jgi:cell volume regulation protein A
VIAIAVRSLAAALGAFTLHSTNTLAPVGQMISNILGALRGLGELMGVVGTSLGAGGVPVALSALRVVAVAVVGIALIVSLISAGGVSADALTHVSAEFLLQMGIGGAVGVLGGRALLMFMRRVPLPSEGLYPLRTLAGALMLFGMATVAHGSGFLAVFAAGIVLGDGRAPYKREIERFHGALASLGEIVAFIVLGLTVDIVEISHVDVWLPGLILGAGLAFVIRPILVGLCLIPARLKGSERAFVLFAGLKGAVPILLGSYLIAAHEPDSKRLYGIIVVVVVFSVVVQGSLVPAVARVLHVPMRTVEQEPWALGVRLQDEPNESHRFRIAAGSPADGSTIAGLAALPSDAWISFIVRDGRLISSRGATELQAGDEVVILADSDVADELPMIFEGLGNSDRGRPEDLPAE